MAGLQPVHGTRHTRADGSDNWSRRIGPDRAAHGRRTRDRLDTRPVGVHEIHPDERGVLLRTNHFQTPSLILGCPPDHRRNGTPADIGTTDWCVLTADDS